MTFVVLRSRAAVFRVSKRVCHQLFARVSLAVPDIMRLPPWASRYIQIMSRFEPSSSNESLSAKRVFEVMMYSHRCWSYVLVSYSSFFLALTSAATLSEPTQLDITRDGANNLSSLGYVPEFHVHPIFAGGPPLDSNSLLMSGVQLMAREAVEPIMGAVPRTFWHSEDPRYASIGIFVLPTPEARAVERRMMMWGLEQSMRYMMEENRFESVRFRMTRDGDDVGSIEYTSLANKQLHMNLGASTSRLEQGSTPAVAEAKEANPLKVVGPQVFCRLCGYDLEVFDVFRPVVMMLREMAEFPARSHIGSYRTDKEIGVTGLRFKDEKRRNPPFFEAQWLVKACLAIPQYMLDKGTFSETDVMIKVDGVLVAVGLLKIQRTPPPKYVRRKKKSTCVIS